jgi:hypothetical protein
MVRTKVKRVITAKNGYIEKHTDNRFNSIAVEMYYLFDLDNQFVDKSINYNDLHKQLTF